MVPVTKLPGNTNSHAANSTAALLVAQRAPEELRAAQVAVAGLVLADPLTASDWERELELRELLEALGLYRRIA